MNDDDYVMIDVSAADGGFAGSTEPYGGDRVIPELAEGLGDIFGARHSQRLCRGVTGLSFRIDTATIELSPAEIRM